MPCKDEYHLPKFIVNCALLPALRSRNSCMKLYYLYLDLRCSKSGATRLAIVVAAVAAAGSPLRGLMDFNSLYIHESWKDIGTLISS